MNQKLSLNFHQIQHFLAISDHGSLRAAAQHLGLSQPAISKSLRCLESALGAPLIHRNPRGATLTTAGELFLSRARLIDNEIVRTTSDIQALCGSKAGHVRIGASAIPSILIIPKAVARFRARHPDVGLDLVGGMPRFLLPRLCDGSLDFVVGPRPTDSIPDSIRATHLMRLKVNILVRKGHPLEHATSLEAFSQAQWVVSSNSSYAKERIQSLFLDRNRGKPMPYIRVDSLFALLSFIKNTDFVGIVPSIENSEDLYGRELAVLKIEEMDLFEEYQLFSRRNYTRSARTSDLIAFMHGEARLYAQAEAQSASKSPAPKKAIGKRAAANV